MKTLRRIIVGILLVAILLPLAVIVAVQIPSMQTFVSKKVTQALSDNIEGNISVGKVYILPLHTAIITDLSITEPEGDTILAVRKLSANIEGKTLFSSEELKVNRIILDGGVAHMRYVTPDETNISRLLAQFASSEKTESSLPWKNISVGKVKVNGIDFTLDNPFVEQPKCDIKAGSVDFNNLDVQKLHLSASDLFYTKEGDAGCRIADLSFTERNSGYNLRTFKASISAGNDGISVKNLKFDDGFSKLTADCELTTESLKDLSSFAKEVPFSLNIKSSAINAATLKAFLPNANIPNLKLKVAGEIYGMVDDLVVDGLYVESESGITVLDLDAKVNGLPDIDNARVDLHLNDCHTTTADISQIIKSVNEKFKESTVSKYLPGETITINGTVNGLLSDLIAVLDVDTGEYGRIDTDIECKGLTDNIPRLGGKVSGQSIAIGKFLNDTLFTDITFSSAVAMELGKKPAVLIDNLNIESFGFKGYNYSGITACGALESNRLCAILESQDPNIQMNADISAILDDNAVNYYKANVKLGHADLHSLKFDSRDTSIVNGEIIAEIEQTEDNVILGQAKLKDIRILLADGRHDLGNINAKAYFDREEQYNIEVTSSLADASYRGSSSIKELASDARVLLSRELGNILEIDRSTLKESEGSNGCTFALKTGNIKPLAAFIMPDLTISEGTTVNAALNGSKSIDIEAKSSLISLGDNHIKNLRLVAADDSGPIRAKIHADIIQRGDIILKNNNITTDIENNTIDIGYRFDNGETENWDGSFNAALLFPEKVEGGDLFIADIAKSYINVEGSKWQFIPSTVRYRNKHIGIEDFRAYCGNQFITANGVVSDSKLDTLNVKINQVDISVINELTKTPVDIQGIFTGKASAFGLLAKDRGMLLDLNGDGLAANQEPLGSIHLLCKWDEAKERFNMLIDNRLNDRKPINAIGYFKPSDKTINVQASLDELAVSWLDPLLTGIVSDMGGSLSGEIKVNGPLNKLSISGSDTRFNNLACKVDFTQVPYIINGPFNITDRGVTFENDTITDLLGNTGRVNGGVSYNNFKNINLGVKFRLMDMLALNTTEADADNGFYGRAFGTGSVSITGPLDNIMLGINVRTGEGAVHIPLNSSGSEKTSILTFADIEQPIFDEYDSLLVKKALKADEKSKSSLGVNVKLNVTQLTEIGLDINRSLGDMLKARGTGNVEINVGRDLFDIKGGYNIDEGSYKFALMGITSKDFIINPGGTINFTGDIMQSDLNMTATYRTKASMGPLIADTTSVSTRRTVNCGIDISGKLSNPQLGFNIDIPDLDPATKGRVEAALSSEDKRLKQFLALLVSGSFVPDEQSGIVNNTTVLYSNASEIMANQVNNIFRQLEIPLDLGFNYQPGTGGVDIFDVAISTQLFNNRVTINGNIGNQDYLSSSSNSEVVGNVDMEVKINKSGRLRINLFSHAADRYSNYLDQTQRNGAGIVFQEEFDTFRELWMKIFRRRYSATPGTIPVTMPRESGYRVIRPLSDTLKISPTEF